LDAHDLLLLARAGFLCVRAVGNGHTPSSRRRLAGRDRLLRCRVPLGAARRSPAPR
jgi:hypothetical protein